MLKQPERAYKEDFQMSWGAISFLRSPSSTLMAILLVTFLSVIIAAGAISYFMEVDIVVDSQGKFSHDLTNSVVSKNDDDHFASFQIGLGDMVKAQDILFTRELNAKEIVQVKKSLANLKTLSDLQDATSNQIILNLSAALLKNDPKSAIPAIRKAESDLLSLKKLSHLDEKVASALSQLTQIFEAATTRAPIDGRISYLTVHQKSLSQPRLLSVSITPLLARQVSNLQVPLQDAMRIHLGQPVRLMRTDGKCQRMIGLLGRIISIDRPDGNLAVDSQGREVVTVTASIPETNTNAEKNESCPIIEGMPIKASIIVGRSRLYKVLLNETFGI